MRFITPSPTLPLKEKGATPLSVSERVGGEVTLSSLVEGLSLPRASQGMRWSRARFLEMPLSKTNFGLDNYNI